MAITALKRLLPLVVAPVLLAMTVWIYLPGITGPALLDDYRNLDILVGLQERADTASDYVLGNRSGALGRSVSMFSFVLEELYFESDTASRKTVNIGLHVITGALVMWLFTLLLAHAGVPRYAWFALAGGALWLVSPLYVSTVLYVVQRMAILSTLFMLLSCIVYAYWRRVLFRSAIGFLGIGVLLACIAFAALAKENGLLVVPILVILEVLWFGGRDLKGVVNPALRKWSFVLLYSGFVVAVILLLARLDWIRSTYRRRDFTLEERLLTQARIVWDYVSQILLPDVNRMGVFHDDVVLSTSISQPPATLFALIGWLCVALASLVLLRWRTGQLVVCAIAFFLIGHAMESTLFSLELYFEHRNYFPGVGLFLLVLVAPGSLSRLWPQISGPLLAWLWLWVVLLATQTSSQVQIWSSAPLLRLQHVTAHPDSARANRGMALHLAGVGALDSSLIYSRRADELSSRERTGDRQLREIAMYCLAGRAIPARLFAELGQVNPGRPFAVVSAMSAVDKIFGGGSCPHEQRVALANRFGEIFLKELSVATASANFFIALAAMENNLARYDNAFSYMQKALEQKPYHTVGLLMQLHFATALGDESEADIMRARLQVLRDKGQLNMGQIQTLELYP